MSYNIIPPTNWTRTDVDDATICTARGDDGHIWSTVTGIEKAMVITPSGEHIDIDQFLDCTGITLADAVWEDFAKWIAENA